MPVLRAERPGREVAGPIDAVGPGVDEGWLGRRVVAHLGVASGGYAELALARQLNSPSLIYSNQIMRTNILHDMGEVQRAGAFEIEMSW